MKNTKNTILILTAVLITSCHGNFFNYDRKDINEYHGKIVVKQHCGFDGLEDSFYVVKDNNGTIEKVSVEPCFCDLYNIGDTIK